MSAEGKAHRHNYQLQREVRERGNVYRFYLCYVPGCDTPHKMTVDTDHNATPPKGGKRGKRRG